MEISPSEPAAGISCIAISHVSVGPVPESNVDAEAGEIEKSDEAGSEVRELGVVSTSDSGT